MKKLFFYLLVSLAFSATSAFAGAGHDHGPASHISEAQAIERANSIIARLIKHEQLESSWNAAPCMGAKKKEGKAGPEWVVTFNNADVKDTAKQNLYVFFSLAGKYLAANFEGVE
jgi:hypothetical protein